MQEQIWMLLQRTGDNNWMNELKVVLSPRLQGILDFVGASPIKTLADIGTDHAYLPIVAVQLGLCDTAIACDLNPGPLAIARQNIRDAGLDGKIETRLGDGLMPLVPGEADCIVIAGMGGTRIYDIISDGMAQARKAGCLILQPQHDIVLLRERLHLAGFEIQDEALVREVVGGKEHFYIIITAQFTGGVFSWTREEYFLGKILLEKGGEVFSAYVRREIGKINRYVSKLSDKAALDSAMERLDWLKNTL